MRILHVIGCLDAGDRAQQLCLLAPALAGHGHTTEIACIGGADRQADELRRQGIAVHRLGWTRWFDVAAIFGLRRLLHDGCWDAVHAWDVPALRASGLIAWNAAPVVISWPSRPKNLRWWDRRIFRRVRRVVVSSEWEHQRCLCEGLSAEWLRFIPPAAPAAQPGVQDVDEAALALRCGLGIYPRRVVCAGPIERGRGYREAIWAADILRHIFPDLHLLIAGSGPRQPALAEMIERLHIGNALLVGDAFRVSDLLATADVCWIPSRVDMGRQTALEAMAHGRAVIASDVQRLRELIRDGDNGCLIPPADPVALARCTRALLRDGALRARLGQAARAHVAEHFSLGKVAARWLQVYDDVKASGRISICIPASIGAQSRVADRGDACEGRVDAHPGGGQGHPPRTADARSRQAGGAVRRSLSHH